jgi:hypothetical protein
MNNKKGVVMIAHNNNTTNYFDMSIYTASRIKKFLDMPVTLITDIDSVDYSLTTGLIDNVILVEPNESNSRNNEKWINKDRFNVFNYSPYYDTLLLDVDYLINSHSLLNVINNVTEFSCYGLSKFLLEDTPNEKMGRNNIDTAWATVIKFRKSDRARHIFNIMNMVQKHYNFYSKIYAFSPYMFRNDYALTIALKVINNHISNYNDHMVGNLLHVSKNISIERLSDTSYKLSKILEVDSVKIKKYMIVNNIDFHVMNKNNFKQLINE